MAQKITLTQMGGAVLRPAPQARPITARRPLAILAILAATEGPVARDYLAGTIWSDVDQSRARGSLRQTLTDLRAAHPAVAAALVVERQTIALDPAQIQTDTQELHAAIARADLEALPPLTPDFEQQFLYGFEELSDIFADWLTQARAQLRAAVLGGLTGALGRADLAPARKIALAEQILAVDPLNEAACREAMRHLARAGEIGRALAHYAQLYDLMGDELGMEPSTPTQDIAIAIKQGRFDAPAPAKSGRPYGEPLLAVLPMQCFGAAPQTAELSEMVIEDIVCKLASVPDLPILSNASTRHLDGADPLAELRQSGATDYALKTTLRQAPPQLRLTAQLLRTGSGVVVWAQSFDATREALFDLQSQIAERVVRTLVPSLHAEETRLAAKYGLGDLSAYQMLLRARDLTYQLDPEKLLQAKAILTECLGRFPGFAPAHLAQAEVHSLALGQSWSPAPEGDKTALRHHLAEALRLSPQDARCLAMKGHNAGIYDRAYPDAIASCGRAIEILPNDAETLIWSTPTLAYTGDHARALRHGHRALALSPQDPMLFRFEHFLSLAHFAAGEYEPAAALGLSSMERNPRYTSNLRVTIGALMALGRRGAAQDLAALVMEINPAFRVRDFEKWQAFQDPARRQAFGALLRDAGLPA